MASLTWTMSPSYKGPFIDVSKDKSTATDTAKTGNDTGGRFRPILVAQGWEKGVHKFVFKLEKPGRVLLGVCTEFVTSKSRDLHQSPEVYAICLHADCSGKQNLWHEHKSTPTSLPGVSVGGELLVTLDCDAHTLKFETDGQACAPMTGLKAGVKLHPFAAFGGDKMEGCVVQIRCAEDPKAAGETPQKKQKPKAADAPPQKKQKTDHHPDIQKALKELTKAPIESELAKFYNNKSQFKGERMMNGCTRIFIHTISEDCTSMTLSADYAWLPAKDEGDDEQEFRTFEMKKEGGKWVCTAMGDDEWGGDDENHIFFM